MRTRRILAAGLAVLLSIGAVTAVGAEPLLKRDSGIAWLGEGNHMFLRDRNGVLKQLQSAISDLVGMDDTNVYCLTGSGRLYAVRIDGTFSSVISVSPQEEELAKYRQAASYELTQAGILYQLQEDGTRRMLAVSVKAACSTQNAIYYAVESGTQCLLKCAPLTDAAMQAFTEQQLPRILSLTASDCAIAAVAEDHSIDVFSLDTPQKLHFDAISALTERAAFTNGTLFRYKPDEHGGWQIGRASCRERV